MRLQRFCVRNGYYWNIIRILKFGRFSAQALLVPQTPYFLAAHTSAHTATAGGPAPSLAHSLTHSHTHTLTHHTIVITLPLHWPPLISSFLTQHFRFMIRLGASASASGRLQSFPCTTRPSSVIQYFAYPTSTSIRYLSSKLKRHPNIRSRVNDSACQELNKNRKIGWKKKKVAVVFGYVGKGYSGLQMIDPAVRTIEREVEEALFQLGCILPTNKQNLDKIGWSRSSRTDKGNAF
jgi:hypothetical protein